MILFQFIQKRAAEIMEKRPPGADDEQHQKGHSHTYKQKCWRNYQDGRAEMTSKNTITHTHTRTHKAAAKINEIAVPR